MTVCLRSLLILFCVGAVCGRAAEAPKVDQHPAKDEQLATAQKVHDIFDAKCTECHGPELPRPKKKFGYVLDLQRVADNPDFVVRGKPEDSEIYKMVLDDEMPGEDADVAPLTAEEKNVVKHWIEIGAPGELPENGAHVPAAVVEAGKPPMPFWQHALKWIGKFHPVTTHFPIALMLVAIFSEALAFWTKRETWFQTTRFLVLLAALSSLVTTPLGWINAYFSSYSKVMFSVLWWHRWIGTATGVWVLVCAGLILISSCPEGSHERNRLRGALLAGAALIGITGFLGSAMPFGLDHYAW